MRELSDGAVYGVAGAVLLLVFLAAALALAVAFGVELTTTAFLAFALGYLVNLVVYFVALWIYLEIDKREEAC
ncbi:MAG: hypothetical protein ACLFMT_01690 [Halobacteriales archaeon]